MAEEFEIKGTYLARGRLQRLTQDWSASTRPAIVNQPRFENGAEGFMVHIFAEGSIRGFLASYNSLCLGFRWRLRVVLNAMASHADWRSCYSFMRAIITDTGGTLTRPDGRILDPAEITMGNAELEADESLRRSATTLKEFADNANVASLCLPNPTYDLQIPVTRFPKSAPPTQLAQSLEKMLIPMAARYQSAHVASTVRVGGHALSVWPLTATIIGDVDEIVIPAREMWRVPMRAALEILGRRVESVQATPQRWYFPAMNLAVEENRLLYDRLCEAGDKL